MPIRIELDGREVETEPGKTLLEVCKANGIEIPTLCNLSELEPYGACRLCLVEIEAGEEKELATACTTLVRDGLKVNTGTKEVIEARRFALELLLSTHVGDCVGPCKLECPADIDVQGYVGLIANGQFEEAVRLVREKAPLPLTLGRVCPAPCEDECRRRLVDKPIAIRQLKQFIAEKATKKDPSPPIPPKSGKRVAVIGAGPAGLTTAYYLRLKGHRVDIFDQLSEPGGMLRYGIPAYRLPRDLLGEEIGSILKMGIRFHSNKTLGKDLTLARLRQEYDAVFLGTGAWKSISMEIPGEGLPRVYLGIDFLKETASGARVELGKKVIVVGGGNTAIDSARTAVRLGAEVTVLYRRTSHEMPAHESEVEEAKEEGVDFHFLAAPVEIIGKDRVEKARCIEMELGEPDVSGRRRPVPIQGSEFDLLVDSVIMACGQYPDLELISRGGIKVGRRVTEVNEGFETNLRGVFAGGDLVLGPSTVVESIATGRKAAFAVDAFLRNEEYKPEKIYTHKKEVSEADYKDRERLPREQMPMLPPAERIKSFEPVELGFTEEQAKAEAKRCMECGCLDVFDCKLKKYAQAYGAIQDRFKGASRDFEIDDRHPRITSDPNKCILCGACARLTNELHEEGVMDFAFRGLDAVVTPPLGESLAHSKSKLLGDLVEFCPTGALVEKLELPKSGPWDCEKVKTQCVGCGMGCELNVDKLGNLPIKTSKLEESWNKGHLCDIGKFEILPTLEGRTSTPMVRVNGKLKKVSLAEALDLIGKKKGPVDVLISPDTTLEEAYLLKELAEKRGGKISFLPAARNSNATLKDVEDAKEIYISKEAFEEFPLIKVLSKSWLKKGGRLVKKLEELGKDGIALVTSSEELLGSTSRVVLGWGANSLGLSKIGIKQEKMLSPILFAYGIDPLKEGVPTANKFLIAQSVSSRGCAKRADVVLPMNSWVEKDGTLVSSFGRVGRLQGAVKSGIIEDWRVIQQIGERFGVKKKYNSLKEITAALTKKFNFQQG